MATHIQIAITTSVVNWTNELANTKSSRHTTFNIKHNLYTHGLWCKYGEHLKRKCGTCHFISQTKKQNKNQKRKAENILS